MKSDLKYFFGYAASGAVITTALLAPGNRSAADVAIAVGAGVAYTAAIIGLDRKFGAKSAAVSRSTASTLPPSL